MEPIIDPRRGDFEDDASSTKRRSLLTLAGNLLVEISLPKLALAWVLILVLPSLSLGIAPLVASAWIHTVKWKFDYALAELGAALMLVVVIALGWFAGRSLFNLARSSFWALNSLAVEPVYVIVREALRYLAEKLLPARSARTQYATLRAAAAAAAGIIICVLALAALVVAWPHTRWVGTLADLASLHQLAPVAVANSVVLVSAYLSAIALVSGIADAAMTQPHPLDSFPPPSGQGRTWRVAHLSDIHVVGERYGFRIESGRSGPRGNERLKQLLEQLDALHAENPLDAILITGDMTDAGRSAEWAEFFDALAPHPKLAELILVLPGNHDLNVVDRANPARLELPTSPNRRLRQLRMLSVMYAIQGRRVHVVDYAKGAVGECLADTMQPYCAEITRFADVARPLVSRALAEIWRRTFPLIVPPDTDNGLGIILLNSNADTQFSFTSALGLMSEDQVRGIKIATAQYPHALWIVALHHHVVEYPRAGHALSERIGTALINGHWFARQLRYLADRAVLMHGHRHIDWIGECERLYIVSAPSPVMEASDDHATWFYIHSLAAGANGQIKLLAPQRIVVNRPTSVTS
jgi:Calcineurin-like phosphoesterase